MKKQNIQTNYSNGSNIFFTSDTHFDHTNIIGFCNRPFKSIEEMNETIISNWNNKVGKDDIVFHLGDFSFGNGNAKQFIDKLNGKIILIMGNHDFKNLKQKDLELFYHYSQQMFIKIEGQKIYLNHNPFLCYGGTYRREGDEVWQLFGHVHSGPYSKDGLDNERLKMLFPFQYDVGVDNNNFTPISFYELKDKITEQIKNYKK